MPQSPYYSAISPGYNRLHQEEQLKKAGLIRENCDLRGILLDVGAGTGIATREFAGQAECIALDPCKEMLQQFPGMKVVGKAEQLPFKPGSFDSVVSLTALHHADLPRAKAEINRVVKQGGVVAVSFFKRARNFPEARALFRNFRAIGSGKDLVFLGNGRACEHGKPF